MDNHATKQQLHNWLAKTGIPLEDIVEVRLTPDTIHGLPVPMMIVSHYARDPDGDQFTTHTRGAERDIAISQTWVPLPAM